MNKADYDLVDALYNKICELMDKGHPLTQEQSNLMNVWYFGGVFSNFGLIAVLEYAFSIPESIAAYKGIGAFKAAQAIIDLVEWVQSQGCKLDFESVTKFRSASEANEAELTEYESAVWNCKEEEHDCAANYVRSNFPAFRKGIELVVPPGSEEDARLKLSYPGELGMRTMKVEDYDWAEDLFQSYCNFPEKAIAGELTQERSNLFYVWYFVRVFENGGLAAVLDHKIPIASTITAFEKMGAAKTAQAISDLAQWVQAQECPFEADAVRGLVSTSRSAYLEREHAIRSKEEEEASKIATYVRSNTTLLVRGSQ